LGSEFTGTQPETQIPQYLAKERALGSELTGTQAETQIPQYLAKERALGSELWGIDAELKSTLKTACILCPTKPYSAPVMQIAYE